MAVFAALCHKWSSEKTQVEPVLSDHEWQKMMNVLHITDFGLDINRTHHQYIAHQQFLMPRDGLIKV